MLMKPLKVDSKNFKNPQEEKNWKTARKGVIIFCVIHILFELLTGNAAFTLSVFANYIISTEYIKNQIFKEKLKESFLLAGLTISAIVFLIRVLIGFLVVYYFK